MSKPNELPSPPVKALVTFEVSNCPNWYVRFGLDRYQKVTEFVSKDLLDRFNSLWPSEIKSEKYLYGIWQMDIKIGLIRH